MSDPREVYDATLTTMIEKIDLTDITSDETNKHITVIERFSKCRPPAPEPVPEIVPTPEAPELTRWEKIRCGIAAALDNETTRTVIKAGGAFAGVWWVAHTTIKKDHVLERQAMGQANQTKP